jgi:hypothetical protein
VFVGALKIILRQYLLPFLLGKNTAGNQSSHGVDDACHRMRDCEILASYGLPGDWVSRQNTIWMIQNIEYEF